MVSCLFQPDEIALNTHHEEDFCFLSALEKELETIFVNFSFIGKNASFKSFLKESKNTLKGDLFVSLKCISTASIDTNKNELLDKLQHLKYICTSNIDEHKNLYLYLDKTVAYKCVLNQVLKSKEKYGMVQLPYTQSYFVMVHNIGMKDCNALRVALLADHLISFLTSNCAKVLCNQFCEYPEFLFNNSSILCTNQCVETMKTISELLVDKSRYCEWKEDINDKNDLIHINGGNHVKTLSLSSNFGNDVGIITISDTKSEVIQNSASLLHFLDSHGTDCDITLHMGLQGHKHKIIQSGCLVKMLELTKSRMEFINCQDVHFKSKDAITVEKYIEHVQEMIRKAMSHRCDSSTLNDKMMDVLVNTVVKFTFLKAGTNAPLTIDFSRGHNSQKSDGIFVQYNFARLCKLLKKFEINVEKGYYGELPELDEVNFILLREKEEWDLLKFVLFFPRLVHDIHQSINSENNFYSNRICIMLNNLSHCFSLYYSRVRVLASPQPQLQKVMHARLWLLRGVHQVMYNSLALINVQGLNQM